jgi:hypothetical protein
MEKASEPRKRTSSARFWTAPMVEVGEQTELVMMAVKTKARAGTDDGLDLAGSERRSSSLDQAAAGQALLLRIFNGKETS